MDHIYLLLILTPSLKAVPMSACETTETRRQLQTSLTNNNYPIVSLTGKQVRNTQAVRRGPSTHLFVPSSNYFYLRGTPHVGYPLSGFEKT